ncbi:MAG: PD-(D/E)XK nuclease family protein [Dehalococcoidia bacterium]
MGLKRESPYIWVTWLTKLLVGENSCEWAAWFKAHHKEYDKVPDAFDSAAWQIEHTALLNQVRGQLEEMGKIVFTEKQNHFSLRGSVAIIGGRPDLIAIAGESGIIYDVKTGKPTSSDHVQVMIYMYAIPLAFRQYRDMVFDGRVVYKDHEVPIPASAINESFRNNLVELIRNVSAVTPPRLVPSALECGFCPIAKSECPERVEEGSDIDGDGEVDDF